MRGIPIRLETMMQRRLITSVTVDPNIFFNAGHCKGVKINKKEKVDGLDRSLTRYLIGINDKEASRS